MFVFFKLWLFVCVAAFMCRFVMCVCVCVCMCGLFNMWVCICVDFGVKGCNAVLHEDRRFAGNLFWRFPMGALVSLQVW